jgi:hypothetical protein
VITPACFPTPHLALRSTDPAQLVRVRAFAVEQAAAAERARSTLVDGWHDAHDRRALLRAVHESLVSWRYQLALRAPGRLGKGIAYDAERFRMLIDDHGPNFDRLGYIGRLRANPVWDEETRTFRGGTSTPAHEIMLAYGAVAEKRFAPGQDVLRNPVVLPGGEQVDGNSLVRGDAARRAADELVERITRRQGRDVQVESGGNPIYLVTAANANRARMFASAMDLLATAKTGDLAAWRASRYLLYQSPITKKGSDAVTRVFLVAVGAVLLGQAPVLEQDADLRSLVCGQAAAIGVPNGQ